jgi:hypothetical protein
MQLCNYTTTYGEQGGAAVDTFIIRIGVIGRDPHFAGVCSAGVAG